MCRHNKNYNCASPSTFYIFLYAHHFNRIIWFEFECNTIKSLKLYTLKMKCIENTAWNNTQPNSFIRAHVFCVCGSAQMSFNNPSKVLYINGDEQLKNRHKHRHADYKERKSGVHKEEKGSAEE